MSVAAPAGRMKRQLRRFAAIGVLVTAVDVGMLVALRRTGRWSTGSADAVAIAAAASISYGLNRAITFGGDPTVRWVDHPSTFAVTAGVAGAVDVAVLSALTSSSARPVVDRGAVGRLVAAKAVAVAAAAGVRVAVYRWVLFGVVRRAIAVRTPRPPAPGDVRLSLVVPAYREAARIAGTIGRVRTELASVAADGGLEVVVVDDGSDDGTAQAAWEAGADQVVVLPVNRGKGAAVRAGVLAARGRSVIFTDADLAYSPHQAMGLLERLESGWDVVVGSRTHTDTTTLVRAGHVRQLGGRVINLLTTAVLLGQYRDTQCGLKGFRSDVARLVFGRTRIDGFAFDVEVFHLVERYRLSLTEVPVEVENSEHSTVRVARDALRLLGDLGRVMRGGRKGWYDLQPGEGVGP